MSKWPVVTLGRLDIATPPFVVYPDTHEKETETYYPESLLEELEEELRTKSEYFDKRGALEVSEIDTARCFARAIAYEEAASLIRSKKKTDA